MNHVYLITGSNEGDRLHHLQSALQFLAQQAGTIVKTSSIYETASWGREDLPSHLNQCILLHTNLSAEELLLCIHKIEAHLGRKRQVHWGLRTIDIDILFFNQAIYNTKNLVIPHPFLSARRFVLTPLAEIACQVLHPIFIKTVQQLLDRCNDNLMVKKLT